MSKHIRVFKPLLCLSMDQDMHASLMFHVVRKKHFPQYSFNIKTLKSF